MLCSEINAVCWRLKFGPIVCTETSIRNFHYSLCNNPEEDSHLLIAVCSEIHTKYINALCEQNIEFLGVKFGCTKNNH
jgi:hypothetical protein